MFEFLFVPVPPAEVVVEMPLEFVIVILNPHGIMLGVFDPYSGVDPIIAPVLYVEVKLCENGPVVSIVIVIPLWRRAFFGVEIVFTGCVAVLFFLGLVAVLGALDFIPVVIVVMTFVAVIAADAFVVVVVTVPFCLTAVIVSCAMGADGSILFCTRLVVTIAWIVFRSFAIFV